MKILYKYFFFCLIVASCLHCKVKPESPSFDTKLNASFIIQNPTNQDWEDETIEIATDFLVKGKAPVDWKKISFSDGEILSYQLVDGNGDGNPETILISTKLKAKEEKKINVFFTEKSSQNNFTKRTQAEISHKVNGKWEERKYTAGVFKNVNTLAVPAEHTDHSEYIRYEGPGWESDKVGYRFYLDWRNAVDVFGKTTDMVLQNVGLDGFASYHESADWGMDVLKVGSSLGIGSIGFWDKNKAVRVEKTDSINCEIIQNGVLQSKIRTSYYGWKINGEKLDLISDLSIQAGSRLTRQDLLSSRGLPNICTGIVKHENGKLIKKTPSANLPWGYIATYGKQSLAADNLGMVVFFKADNFVEFQEDKNSHVLILKPDSNKLSYYFAAAWEQEPNGVKNLEKFIEYLDAQVLKLNSEVIVNH